MLQFLNWYNSRKVALSAFLTGYSQFWYLNVLVFPVSFGQNSGQQTTTCSTIWRFIKVQSLLQAWLPETPGCTLTGLKLCGGGTDGPTHKQSKTLTYLFSQTLSHLMLYRHITWQYIQHNMTHLHHLSPTSWPSVPAVWKLGECGAGVRGRRRWGEGSIQLSIIDH